MTALFLMFGLGVLVIGGTIGGALIIAGKARGYADEAGQFPNEGDGRGR